MKALRLYRIDNPDLELGCRLLSEGRLVIGRDSNADWTITDSELAVSRVHCVLQFEGGRILLQDQSTNGVYVGADKAPVKRGEPEDITSMDVFWFGPYMMKIEKLTQSKDAAVPPKADSGALLYAFCEGAGIDVSIFAQEDPVELMRRLGGVYTQMVSGVSALMSERLNAKSDYGIDRTTISSAGNNPFKWAPARVAADLLRTRDDGYLYGPSALEASFEDLRNHLVCMMSASRESMELALNSISPARIEESMRDQTFVLRNRSEACWKEFERLHADLAHVQEGRQQRKTEQMFRDAYARNEANLQKRSA